MGDLRRCHVGFIPKFRRKVISGELRKRLGEVFHELARQKECRSIEGHLLPDHGQMCIEIPPKSAVASMIGFLKGKNALVMPGGCKRRREISRASTFGRTATRCQL